MSVKVLQQLLDTNRFMNKQMFYIIYSGQLFKEHAEENIGQLKLEKA